ncbi:MAG: cupin domain-containing protein [Pirellulales bacterium]|nr:cupin domain-containing protein [Pirellulales bacterium]
MKVQHHTQIPSEAVTMEGASKCHVRYLIGPLDLAPNFAMRQFTVEPGGCTPKHLHAYEHEIYILEGQGEALEGTISRPLIVGDVVYVAPDEVHQFRNTGDVPLIFLCLIPNSSNGKQVTVVPESPNNLSSCC